jgi:hypothetical protein
MAVDVLHLVPADFLQHRQTNPSLESERTHHVMSPPQDLHCIILRSKPIAFRNSMAITWSLNRLNKNDLFGPPSALTIRRPCEKLATFCILRMRSSYCVTTSKIWATIVITGFKKRTLSRYYFNAQAVTVLTETGSRLHCGCFMKYALTWEYGKPEARTACSTTRVGVRKIGVTILQWFSKMPGIPLLAKDLLGCHEELRSMELVC